MGDGQKNKDVVRKIEGAWNKHDVVAGLPRNPTANLQKIDFESWSISRFKNGKVVESWGLNDGLLGMIQLGGLKPPQM